MNYDYDKEFRKFALSEGISSQKMDYFLQEVEGNMTPYILEEREMRVTQMDIFSRLMRDRILWVAGPVNDHMSTIVQAQLMFLDNQAVQDITMHIDTPGGSVKSGLSMIDVMKYVKSDIITVNTGMCASMGSVLLSSGTKGKRSSLRFSKVMTHQVSHGTGGNIQDTRISQVEAEKYNFILLKMLGENCGKSYQEVMEFSRRDRWYNSDEALAFGLIDEVIGVDEKNLSMTKLLEGFEVYYQEEVLNSKK